MVAHIIAPLFVPPPAICQPSVYMAFFVWFLLQQIGNGTILVLGGRDLRKIIMAMFFYNLAIFITLPFLLQWGLGLCPAT